MNAPLRRPLRTYVTVDAEVDISEFDDEVIIAEMERRQLNTVMDPTLDDLYLAVKFDQRDRAFELLRIYLMNQTGRVL